MFANFFTVIQRDICDCCHFVINFSFFRKHYEILAKIESNIKIKVKLWKCNLIFLFKLFYNFREKIKQNNK